MSFVDGDFVKIEYDAWRAVDNKLVYTTDEKKAEENGIHYKDVKYGPQLIVIGKSNTIQGLDKAIKGMSVSESKKIELEPKDAFGERDPNLVRIMPLSDFRARNINPQVGMQVDLDGIIAVIRSVNSGRVVVDANHPLAGEKLIYNVKVVEKLDKDEDRVKALLEASSLVPKALKVEAEVVRMQFGGDVDKNADFFVNKSTAIASIFRYMDKINKVFSEEEYDRPKGKTGDADKAQAQA
ncbi:MAG: FKBP-type peptidyl-prolyl cis-trans isomerase [Candidatus Micrarchaeia archaeon]